MKLENIDFLISGRGDVTLGKIAGAADCAAVACDEARPLAMLVRRRDESLAALLGRLDRAIGDAWDKDAFVDEINGESHPGRGTTSPSSRRAPKRARG